MARSILEYLVRDNHQAKFLDRTIPLEGASHADVVEYAVDVPMRYAECFARTTDGRKVRLRDSRQFVAWSGPNGKRCFLFKSHRGRIEIQTDRRLTDRITKPAGDARRFIARDGNQMLVHRWGRIFSCRLVAGREEVADSMYALPQAQ